jgi:hypothetical protein
MKIPEKLRIRIPGRMQKRARDAAGAINQTWNTLYCRREEEEKERNRKKRSGARKRSGGAKIVSLLAVALCVIFTSRERHTKQK